MRHLIDVFAFLILILALALRILAFGMSRFYRLAARLVRRNSSRSSAKKQQ